MTTHHFPKTLKTSSALLSGFLIAAALVPATAGAQEAATVFDAEMAKDLGGAERINHAGRLRMLSQKIAAASCLFHAGVDTDVNAALAAKSADEFDQIMNALEMGDESLGIFGAEKKRKTLTAIEAVKTEWSGIRDALKSLLDGSDPDQGIALISARNTELLAAAQALVTIESAEYSNPSELLQADALRIDIAGRERMLIQRMLKEACGVNTGNAAMGDLAALQKTMNLFEVSLTALRDGNEQAGIAPPPTPEIKTAVEAVWSRWEPIRDGLGKISGPASADAAAMAAISTEMNTMLAAMNEVVSQYAEASKLGI